MVGLVVEIKLRFQITPAWWTGRVWPGGWGALPYMTYILGMCGPKGMFFQLV